LTIVINNLDLLVDYSCRFVRLSEYRGGSGEDAVNRFDVPATLVDYRTLSCITPCWGCTFPGTDTRVLVVNDTDSHFRFERSKFNYSFYEVWDYLETKNEFGARGGDLVNVSAYGLDPEAQYQMSFQDDYGNSMLSNVTVPPGQTTSATLYTPSWGRDHIAAYAHLTLFHLPHDVNIRNETVDTSPLAVNVNPTARSTVDDVGVSGAVYTYMTPDNTDGWLHFYPVTLDIRYSSKGGLLENSSLAGGGAQGGQSLILNVFGFDTDAHYLCRFTSSTNVSVYYTHIYNVCMCMCVWKKRYNK
jgi:hypothetical protein